MRPEKRRIKMKQKSKIQKIAMCSLFTALTAVGAFIRIPVPVVPFTLQFLFTMLAGVFLGGKLGAVTIITAFAAGPAIQFFSEQLKKYWMKTEE